MRKQTLMISLGVGGFILLGGGLAFYQLNKDAGITFTPVQPTRGSSTSGAQSIPLGQSREVQQSPQQGQGLQVLGSNNTSQSQNDRSQLPSPSQFSVYEQYANEPNALFSEIVVGNGREASPGDTLAVVYTGWLTDGQVFDQSRRNEQGQIEAFSFTLGTGQVIPGWEQTLGGMREGGKRRLVIPAVAGYGAAGQGEIPPNAMLIFDVELVQVDEPFDPNAGL